MTLKIKDKIILDDSVEKYSKCIDDKNNEYFRNPECEKVRSTIFKILLPKLNEKK